MPRHQDENVNGTTSPSQRRGIMRGGRTEIGVAAATMLIPMILFSAVLMGLVYSHQMPNQKSSYSIEKKTAIPLGSAYYVNYSATTLVYIASLSSTVSTLLLSAAMVLFSYSLASKIAHQSDNGDVSLLPSPYQLELLIRMIDGRIMALWSYVLYFTGSRQRRTKVMPVLMQASLLMMALLLLVGLITLADLWLHLGTKSVQYLEMRPENTQAFLPGRGLSTQCLSNPYGNATTPEGGIDSSIPTGCIIFRGDAVNQPTLANQTEFVRTAGNQSVINQVYYYYAQAVLGPYSPPPEVDFEATSFGSHTACRVVTSECGAQSVTGARNPYPWSFNFKCNDTAGLNLTGNFQSLMVDPKFPSLGLPANLSGAPNGDPDTQIQKGNSMLLTPYDMAFQYFYDTAKHKQIDSHLGNVIEDDKHQLNWAVAFNLHLNWAFWIENNNPSGFPIQNDSNQLNPWAALNLVGDASGGASGVMSCQTNISEIDYEFVDNTLRVKESRTPRENASIPFVSGITADFAYEQLHQGLQQSFVSAKYPEDLAAGFAASYDQSLLSVPAGVMQHLPVTSATRRVITPVARVPRAPFVTLIVLNLLYAFVGVVLTGTAVWALSAGQAVKDAQARLSVAAVVAESFENPALGDDAHSVSDLYAERRGKVTRRVALGRAEGGGRRFKQIVIKGVEESGELLR